jgi:hypothetical protein
MAERHMGGCLGYILDFGNWFFVLITCLCN